MIADQLQRVNAPRQPMYSPEEAAARKEANDREYQMGILGLLSASEGLQGAGGAVLKNALALRQPKVSEHGVADPISGKFTYDPEYLQERENSKLDKLMQLKAADESRRDARTQDQTFRQSMLDQQERFRQSMAGGGNLGTGSAPPVGVDAQQNPVFRMRTGQLFKYGPDGQPIAHEGPLLPKPSSSQPTGEERKSYSQFLQADTAWKNMQKLMTSSPGAEQVPLTEAAVTMLPKVGDALANRLRTDERQQFAQAANQLSDALLRAATGAGMNEYEARENVKKLVPVYGDKQGTRKQKAEGIPVFLEGLRANAGRAMPAAAPGAGGANDPLGLRR
jgi:hypothetical protein